MDRAVSALSVCAEKLKRRRVSPRPLGRDRGLPPRGQRPPFRRAGAARDRHLPRDHRARGGSAARHARLPPPARARRRPGPDLRHRRRLDRIGADRHRRRRAPDQMLVERALGRGLADRERGPRLRHHRGAARRLWPDARARPPRLPPLHRPAAARPRRHQADGDERHRHHSGQRPSRAAELRPARGRRAQDAGRGDARDQRHPVGDGP